MASMIHVDLYHLLQVILEITAHIVALTCFKSSHHTLKLIFCFLVMTCVFANYGFRVSCMVQLDLAAVLLAKELQMLL